MSISGKFLYKVSVRKGFLIITQIWKSWLHKSRKEPLYIPKHHNWYQKIYAKLRENIVVCTPDKGLLSFIKNLRK